MVIIILAPEVLITLNIGQLINAQRSRCDIRKQEEEDGVPWSLTHSLFADMVGFVVREHMPERVRKTSYAGSAVGNNSMKIKGIDYAEDRTQFSGQKTLRSTDLKHASLEHQQPKRPRTYFILADEIAEL